jgi:hypothetical protein
VIEAGNQLDAIACRTATDCVAVDAAGRALEGDPRGGAPWSVQQLGATGSLAAVSCPSALQCVAVDSAGNVFAGSSGPLPPVPAALAPPAITGIATLGHRLVESHARWSNGPTSYADQWERCNAAGLACAAIAGATGQEYTLGAADVGHTVRVSETAANITGAGPPRVSAPTSVVRPLVAVSRASISGVSSGKTRLALTLTAGPGEPPIKAIALSVPSVFSVAHGGGAVRGIAVVVGNRHPRYVAHLRARTVTITLSRPASRIEIVIGPGLLGVSQTE